MEKTYRFLDHYAIAASLGILIALIAFSLSRPRPLYLALGAAAGIAALVGLFELACGYVRVYKIDDESFTSICLGKSALIAGRADVRRLVVESALIYSRLLLIGEAGTAGKLEGPSYVIAKMANDLSAWWGVELEERQLVPILPRASAQPH
nr:MAG: hypothetical protein TU35_02540 [Thermoproteus sp. AZ2]